MEERYLLGMFASNLFKDKELGGGAFSPFLRIPRRAPHFQRSKEKKRRKAWCVYFQFHPVITDFFYELYYCTSSYPVINIFKISYVFLEHVLPTSELT